MSSPRSAAISISPNIDALAATVAGTLNFSNSPLGNTIHTAPPPTRQIATTTQMMEDTPQYSRLSQTDNPIVKQKQLREITSYLLTHLHLTQFNQETLSYCISAYFKDKPTPEKTAFYSDSYMTDNTDCWHLGYQPDTRFHYELLKYPNGDTDEGLTKSIHGKTRLIYGDSFFQKSQTRLMGVMAWLPPVNAMILIYGDRKILAGDERRNLQIDQDNPDHLIGNRVCANGDTEVGIFAYDKGRDCIYLYSGTRTAQDGSIENIKQGVVAPFEL